MPRRQTGVQSQIELADVMALPPPAQKLAEGVPMRIGALLHVLATASRRLPAG
jgi:hypothetical protein